MTALVQTLPEERILQQIFLIRGHKVMLDLHLCKLYGVENRALKQAVRRNMDLFPPDFLFILTDNESTALVSQNVIPRIQQLGGALPYAFTESGVAMLSAVLKSRKAREMNIAIMRAFVSMRQMLIDNTELRLVIEEIRKKTEHNSKNIELVFRYLDELIKKKADLANRERIGFKPSETEKK
jgi:hypothetical protein